MKFKEALGIDVSKKTIDVCLFSKKSNKVFSNSPKGYKSMIEWAEKQSKCSVNEMAICFEHTGLYSLPIAMYLQEKEIVYSMVPALEIKRSLGITRGKSDQVDALRIAEYAYLRKDFLKQHILPSKNILKLQKILSVRSKLVRQRAGYMSTLKENKEMLCQTENKLFFDTQKKMIKYLSKQLEIIEEEILRIVRSDEELNHLYTLVTSVRGIGMVLAVNFIVLTNCFTSFDDSRKFACYSGIAPFEKQSGTSLKSPARVSHFANKKMKALLNIAAWSAVQHDPELKEYYNKRINAGKSKMSTINIVRNKLVHRVFAVVKRNTPFVIIKNYAA